MFSLPHPLLFLPSLRQPSCYTLYLASRPICQLSSLSHKLFLLLHPCLLSTCVTCLQMRLLTSLPACTLILPRAFLPYFRFFFAFGFSPHLVFFFFSFLFFNSCILRLIKFSFSPACFFSCFPVFFFCFWLDLSFFFLFALPLFLRFLWYDFFSHFCASLFFVSLIYSFLLLLHCFLSFYKPDFFPPFFLRFSLFPRMFVFLFSSHSLASYSLHVSSTYFSVYLFLLTHLPTCCHFFPS